MTLKRTLAALGAVLPLALAGGASAAEGKIKELKEPSWTWEGIFGRYDQQQLQRGYQVYREVCASCHSMKLVAFRHLAEDGGPFYLEECPIELGLPSTTDCSDPAANPIVKALAADYQIEAGVDDSGDPLIRPGLPADYLPSPYANRQQAMLANGGAYPPDMSLLVKSRVKGRNYIYSLITGYEEPPAILDVPPGQYYNPYYPGDTASMVREEYLDEEGHILHEYELPPGGAFKMAPPLQDGIVTYEDGSPETVDQYARDVVSFLQWSSEPKLEQRKEMGGFVMLYLFAFAGIVYASYRQIWRNVEH